jgi:hypothetical protein
MNQENPLSAAEWKSRAEQLARRLEKIRVQLVLTQLVAVTLFFCLAAVLAFR